MWSCHHATYVFCLPLVLLPLLGCHSVTLHVHLLSSQSIRWPAHLYLTSLIIYDDILYLGLFPDFCVSDFVSYCDVSIFLSTALCAVISVCSSCLVVVHVSAPYVIVGITHCSYILLRRDIGSLRSQSISLNLPKQLHPAFILIGTSSHVWFYIITVWPRYLYLSTFSITSFTITIVSSDLKLVIYFVFPLCILSPIFLLPWFSSLSCTSISFTDVAIRATSSANLRSVNFSPSKLSPL